jgi:hypothetical protein
MVWGDRPSVPSMGLLPDLPKDSSPCIFLKILFYSYVHIMFGSFLPPSSHPLFYPLTPSLTPPYPSLSGRNYYALFSNFVEERV